MSGREGARQIVAEPDATDIAEHLDTCVGCTSCADRAWCEDCQTDTIPIRDRCHWCDQPVSRHIQSDRLGEH